jgi:hypothetical protein
MILYSLTFIIIILFVYETFKNIKNYNKKVREADEKSSENRFENFDTFDYPQPAKNIVGVKDKLNDEEYPPYQICALDTTKYKSFAPLLFVPKKKFYFSRENIEQEAVRLDNITKDKIKNVEEMLKKETESGKRRIFEAELNLHKWRKYPFKEVDEFGVKRKENDILTDYLPEVFGQQRIWEEVHFHTKPKNN